MVIILNPKNTSSYFYIGNIYAETGDIDKAIKAYTIGLQLKPDNVDILFQRGINFGKELISVDDIGLYKIVYYDKDNTQIELNEIAECLSNIEDTYFTNEFINLLNKLFSSIAHLIKDKSYAHEDEYRLLFIDSIEKEKEYIKINIEDNKCYGIYVETEPLLFQDDKDKVFFGPKLQEDDFIKYRDAFKKEGLPIIGLIDNMLKHSGIHYR